MPTAKPADRRPNILWYCADQLRFDAIGPSGNPYVRTPNLDRLAATGTTFTKAYCQAPICTPSRGVFLTGKYPASIPLNCNGNATFPEGERLVIRRLADIGYDCGLVGKLHLAGAADGREVRTDDGYRYFKYSHAPRNNWSRGHDYVDWIQAKGVDPDDVLTVKTNTFGDLMEPTAEKDNVPPDLHQTTWATEMAVDFVDQERGGPWLLSVNVYDPHPPFNPPWEYYRRYDPDSLPGPLFRESDLTHQGMLKAAGVDFQSSPRRPEQYGGKKLQAAYYAMIEMVDEHVGRILDHLDRSGQLSNTIVIFSTDHGESCGDHGLTQKGPRFFEGMVNVPLIMAFPGRFQAGLKSDALVELTDIMPTLMDCVGLPIPADVQGRSLLPILTGAASPHQHRDFVRTECYAAFDMPNRTFATMYRERRWKLIVYHGLNLGELYDMEADPDEYTSLWDSPEHQSIKTELLLKSYDATIKAMPYGPPLVMPY